VLATDISTQVLAHARSGEYSDEEIEPVPAATRARHFERVSGTGAQRVVADTCRFRKI
jgi:chemotaxis methyl-accepting protein methylase